VNFYYGLLSVGYAGIAFFSTAEKFFPLTLLFMGLAAGRRKYIHFLYRNFVSGVLILSF